MSIANKLLIVLITWSGPVQNIIFPGVHVVFYHVYSGVNDLIEIYFFRSKKIFRCRLNIRPIQVIEQNYKLHNKYNITLGFQYWSYYFVLVATSAKYGKYFLGTGFETRPGRMFVIEVVYYTVLQTVQRPGAGSAV